MSLEPNTHGDTDLEHVLYSIAISVRRMADALEAMSLDELNTKPLNAYGETIGTCLQGQLERGLRGIPNP